MEITYLNRGLFLIPNDRDGGQEEKTAWSVRSQVILLAEFFEFFETRWRSYDPLVRRMLSK